MNAARELAAQFVSKGAELFRATHWISGQMVASTFDNDNRQSKPVFCSVGVLRGLARAKARDLDLLQHPGVVDQPWGLDPSTTGTDDETFAAYVMAMRALACTCVLDEEYVKNGMAYAGDAAYIGGLPDDALGTFEDIVIGWNDMPYKPTTDQLEQLAERPEYHGYVTFDVRKDKVIAGFEAAAAALAEPEADQPVPSK